MARFSTIVLSLITLAGCSIENNVSSIEDGVAPVENNASDMTGEGTTNNGSGDATNTDDDQAVDEGDDDTDDTLIDPDECGFLIDQMFANPSVETESLAIFSNIGDTELEIRQGETAHYQIAVTASECGDIDLNLTLFEVRDTVCETGVCWIDDLALSNIPMYFTDITDNITFNPYDLDQQVNNLVYVYKDEVSNGGSPLNGINGNMTTIHISAGTTKIVEFDFTATETIPVGSTISILLGDSQWTDDTTGNIVWDWSGVDNKVNYTVIE